MRAIGSQPGAYSHLDVLGTGLNLRAEPTVLKDVLWLVSGLVATMFVLSLLGLGDLATFPLKSADVSDWIRTIATVVAATVAVLAYRTWRRPDDAKRRADTAELILRQSQKVETAALGARDGGLVVLTEDVPVGTSHRIEQAEALARAPPREKLEALELELRELRTYRAEAAVLFRDTRAPELINKVLEAGGEIRKAYDMVRFLDSIHLEMMGPAKFDNLADKVFDAVGVRFAGPVIEAPKDDDPFKTSFERDCDELRQVLTKFLVE